MIPRVQFELTRYLSDNWVPVIEKDVDGPNSLPLRWMAKSRIWASSPRIAVCHEPFTGIGPDGQSCATAVSRTGRSSSDA
jgi:hypothetical protein